MKREKTDENFTKELIKDVEVNANVKFITRIGDQFKEAHPIKVVLDNSHQRYLVPNLVPNLKGNKAYQEVSITEEFTLFERSMIKEWSNKAKDRNKKEQNDSKYILRVLETPSKGLERRIEKR